MIFQNPKERTRFLKFAFVGIIGAVIDFGAFNLLIYLTPIASIWASAISFTLAVISNFLWNRYWTYPDSRSKPITQQVFQFIVVSLIGMGIRLILFVLLESALIRLSGTIFPVKFFLTPAFIGHNTTLAISVLIVMMWNFIANRFWTYSDVD
jgi:putative flippase GtrA